MYADPQIWQIAVKSLNIIGYKIPWPETEDKKLEPKPYVFTAKTDDDNSAAGSPPPQSGAGSSSSSSTDLVKAQQQPARVANIDPLVIPAPYPPSLAGLVAARIHCRFLMNRIVKEVDLVTKYPEYAHDEERLPPYMSPSLFRELLPVSCGFFLPVDDLLLYFFCLKQGH